MKLIEEVLKQFSSSKPIFVATLSSDGTDVTFRLKDQYMPNQGNYEDPLTKLAATLFQESMNRSTKKFVQCTPVKFIYKNVVSAVTDFYVEHAQLKNPKQSVVYKWLDTMDNCYHPAAEGFVGLYRYISRNGGMRHCPDEIVENVLAILELMKEKYATEKDSD